jgi:hypothetical protein
VNAEKDLVLEKMQKKRGRSKTHEKKEKKKNRVQLWLTRSAAGAKEGEAMRRADLRAETHTRRVPGRATSGERGQQPQRADHFQIFTVVFCYPLLEKQSSDMSTRSAESSGA